jgi:hypothetical protein
VHGVIRGTRFKGFDDLPPQAFRIQYITWVLRRRKSSGEAARGGCPGFWRAWARLCLSRRLCME